MRIWITRPFDDDGFEEVETTAPPEKDFITYTTPGMRHCDSGVRDGEYWHRTKAAAVSKATRYRAERIAHHLSEYERIASLPPLKL